MFSSIKASGGLIIIGYYATFLGTVFWTILELFFVEATRTNKPFKLLKQEGLGWVIMGSLLMSLGVCFVIICAHQINSFMNSSIGKVAKEDLFGPSEVDAKQERFISVDSESQRERTETNKVILEMDLPLNKEVYEQIVWKYFFFFDDYKFTLPEEIKLIFVRSAVYHKKPVQFLCVILSQIVMSVTIGIFTYGHGSAGSAIVCAFYLVYLFVSGAGSTFQYFKGLWRIATDRYVDPRDVFKGVPIFEQIAEVDDGGYTISVVAIAWQCYVLAQAYSISGEVPVLNFEHSLVTCVTLLVQLTSVCVALLTSDAATAAATLVTFDFIAKLDDQFIDHEMKYLQAVDFENIKPRPLFHEDYLAVCVEILLIAAGGAAVTNCIVGLVF